MGGGAAGWAAAARARAAPAAVRATVLLAAAAEAVAAVRAAAATATAAPSHRPWLALGGRRPIDELALLANPSRAQWRGLLVSCCAHADAAPAHAAIIATNQNANANQDEEARFAQTLLKDIIQFLKSRGGEAPTGLVVDAFADKVTAERRVIFRNLLKQCARLERNPTTNDGNKGFSAWVLKSEYDA